MTPSKLARIESEDEVDLRELIAVIWKGKWIITIITLLFSVVAVLYAINQPNIYKSEALLAPVEQDQSLGGLQGQLGGLASLAGINLGSGSSNKTQLALEILKSRSFVSGFIERHNILPDLMAAEEWDINANKIIYKPELYDAATKTWVKEVSSSFSPKPSMQEAYKVFVQKLSVTTKAETGMVSVSIEHISPFIAKNWVHWLVEDINLTMKKRDVEEAEKSTAFLASQLAETQITDIREVLYRLVEEQAKTVMFANVRDEYVFKIIDPAIAPEKKFGPSRSITCVLGAMFGFVIGAFVVLLKYFR